MTDQQADKLGKLLGQMFRIIGGSVAFGMWQGGSVWAMFAMLAFLLTLEESP